MRTFLPAWVETVSARQAAELVSLSRGGAALQVEHAPLVGSAVVVRCGPIDAFGTVVWTDGRVCGVKFDEPIPEEQVLGARYLSDRQPEVLEAQRRAAAKAWAEGRRA